jgi:rfaE bifunctional protein kinase chain/domain
MSLELIGNFSKLQERRILVAGDLMLDTYTIGKARRISPEAPVAVIHVEKQEELLGGAGNVLLNLKALGAKPYILGRVGNDAAGQTLSEALVREGVSIEGILVSNHSKTPVKNRIVSDNQQIVRVDHESISALTADEEEEIIRRLPHLLNQVELVAISDYAKGFLTPKVLQALIQEARKRNLFIIADPKGNDFSKYQGVSLIKPNLSEAYAAANVSSETPLDTVAHKILERFQIEKLLITRSADGISLFNHNGTRQGDTVLAMLAFALANELDMGTAISFSNIAAGIAVEHFGCAQVTLGALAQRLLELDVRNKVFDLEHFDALEAALDHGPCHLVTLSGTSLPTAETIEKILHHKRGNNQPILGLIEDQHPNPQIVSALAALHPIDFLLLNGSKERLKKSSLQFTSI